MKLAKKISIGSINGVRGGFRDVTARFLAMSIVGIVQGVKEKVSDSMGTSYAFNGEFLAINKDGEETRAPIAFLPEPAQSLLKSQVDALIADGITAAVEFGFDFFVVPNETAVLKYEFECQPKMKAAPSSALAALAQSVGVQAEGTTPQLGHDTAPTNDGAAEVAQADAEPAHASKGGKGKK